MLQYLVFISIFLSLFGAYSYIKDTIKGNTKPNRVTWFLWALSPLIGAIAAFSKGIFLPAIPVFMAGFGPLLIFIGSFFSKKSYWKLGKFDYFFGFFSILGLILWGITKEPFYAILFSILSDFLASLPTIRKSIYYPETESIGPYLACFINQSTAFLAIKSFSFIEIAFPLYLFVLCGTLIIFIYFGKKKIGK